MKHVKKLLSLLLALTLVLALGTTAFAAETYSITITNTETGHTYEAYQIFDGDLAQKDGNKILSNIVWGSGVDQTKEVGGKTLSQAFDGKTAAEVAETLKSEADAKAFAQKVAPYLTAAKESTAGEGNYVVSGLDAGYYLVKDKDNSLADANDFYTAYIMQVVGNVTAQPKGDKPSLDKQIKHNDDNTWGVVGDNQIGDTVEFRTVSTVPNVANYTKYDYVISDTMSEGLTSNVKSAADVKILVNDTGDALGSDYYTVEANGNSFTLKIDILKAIADGKMKTGDSLYTYYTGVLNENAKVYDEGSQNNVAHLEYSNNPNNSEDKGKTPDSKVYDWTFKMGINKVDKEGTALTGAKFVLSKNGSLNVADMNCDENGVPAVTESLIGLVKVSDGVYRIAKADDSDIVYVIDAGNPVIKGLDDSVDYYLYETKAPAGYNLLSAPVQFKITAAYTADGSALQEGMPTVKVGTADPSTTLSTNVVNNSGAELPSTGGIGTTIFYVLGGLLVIAAGVILVTKKRMSKSEG